MLLISVTLHHIRSYLHETIRFPEGSILLAGDIGAGKSTILLAIEFVLFGIQRSHVSGASLLRHGKNEGSVELVFSIGNAEYRIHRTLKRGAGVQQGAGYIIFDGKKREGTAVELKSMALQILGYPQELVSRGRDVIYRYTMYTPQEEMKQILFEDTELRLDTIRKIFGVDKYKLVKENAGLAVRDIRERIRISQAQIADLSEKQGSVQQEREALRQAQDTLQPLLPQFASVQGAIQGQKTLLERVEGQLRSHLEMQARLSGVRGIQAAKERQVTSIARQADQLAAQITALRAIAAPQHGEQRVQQEIAAHQSQIMESERELREIQLRHREHGLQHRQSEQLIREISSLSTCPVCRQEVGEGHKRQIISTEEQRARGHAEEISQLQESQRALESRLAQLRPLLEYWQQEQQRTMVYRVQEARLQEHAQREKELLQQRAELAAELAQLQQEMQQLGQMAAANASLEARFREEQRQLDILAKEEQRILILRARIEQEMQGREQAIARLDAEIAAKERVRQGIHRLQQVQRWLEVTFINLMDVMERHIMLSIFRQFNELFQQWFSPLIDDERLHVRLDDSFTPVIEQNGYEAFIEQLSGGEKSAVALAYRLSLNKVINDFMVGIQTKDIIILDEPTDGFSSEQLDKIRDVLEQLNMRQVIIVSHESKIESFVQHVIRVQKQEHVSSVMG